MYKSTTRTFQTETVDRFRDTNLNNAIEPDENNLVIINAVIVSDSTIDSAAGLNPPLSTNVTPPPTTQPPASGGGGGGSLGIVSLLGLLLLRRRRLFR